MANIEMVRGFPLFQIFPGKNRLSATQKSVTFTFFSIVIILNMRLYACRSMKLKHCKIRSKTTQDVCEMLEYRSPSFCYFYFTFVIFYISDRLNWWKFDDAEIVYAVSHSNAFLQHISFFYT